MALIPGNEVVSPSRVRTLEKYVVVGVRTHLESTVRDDQMRALTNLLEQLQAEAFPNLELRSR
jgi:hypothetical protein